MKYWPFVFLIALVRECTGHGSFTKKPHVIFVLIDDLGYDDLGYVNPDVKSPNIDYLANNALHFEKYYNQPSCTPSRAALMTGRYNIRYGLQSGVIKPDEPEAIPLSETLLPKAFKKCGYNTSMHGKWHLGYYTEEHCPQKRGFDRFFGFYLGSQDYFYHDSGNDRGESDGPSKETIRTTFGFRAAGYDFREAYSNGTEKIRFDLNGTYSTKAIAEDFIKKLDDYDPKTPLFEFLSFQDVHGPLQFLHEYSSLFEKKDWSHNRKILTRKIAIVDHYIGLIVNALKKKGFWQNTVMVVTSDNGGAREEGASNWPLRGSKGTILEGGIRGRAFLHSPIIPENLKGKSFPYVMHVTDWYPTLLRMSGCEMPENAHRLDGAAQDIFHNEPELKRTHILHFMDPLKVEARKSDIRTFPVLSKRKFDVTVKAAIRSENWKLITGRPCHSGCSYSNKERNSRYVIDRVSLDDVESSKLVRLYKIMEDPIERNEISHLFPEIVDKFLIKLADYYDEQRIPQNEKRDHSSTPTDGVWRPWLKKEKYFYKSFTGTSENENNVSHHSHSRVSEALKSYVEDLEQYDGTVIDF